MPLHNCDFHWDAKADTCIGAIDALVGQLPPNPPAGWGRRHLANAAQYIAIKALYLDLRAHLDAHDTIGTLTYIGGGNPQLDGAAAMSASIALADALFADRDSLVQHVNDGVGWLTNTAVVPNASLNKATLVYGKVRGCVDPVT